MKTICSRWSVMALVLGTAVTACSADTGETGPGSGSGTGPGGEVLPPDLGVPGETGTQGVSPQLRAAPPKVDPGSPVKPTARVANISGIVTELGGGISRLGLGGQGTLTGAASVQLSELTATGELRLLAEVDIDASGNFSAQLPLGINLVIAQVIDISGKVLGGAIVGATGSVSGNIVLAAPITTETSIELAVLLDIGSCKPTKPGQSSVGLGLDVSVLIDAKLSAALIGAVKAGIDVDVLVRVLANATVSANRARVQTLIEAGIDIDVDAQLKAQIAAIARLNAGLTAALSGQGSLLDVTAQLIADLDASLALNAKVSANLRVRAQVAANLAFSAQLAASLKGVANAQGVVFASVHASAKIEAQIAATAILDIVKLAGGSQAAIDIAAAAGVKLRADVDAAVDVRGLTQARLDFLAVLSGKAGGSGTGLLGDLVIKASGDIQLMLAGVLDAVAKLAIDLEAKLSVQASATVTADVCIDVDASVDLDLQLSALIKVLAKFTADVQALKPGVQAGATIDLDIKALADLLATVEILLRVKL